MQRYSLLLTCLLRFSKNPWRTQILLTESKENQKCSTPGGCYHKPNVTVIPTAPMYFKLKSWSCSGVIHIKFYLCRRTEKSGVSKQDRCQLFVKTQSTSSHLRTGTEHPSFKRFFLKCASDEVGWLGTGRWREAILSHF